MEDTVTEICYNPSNLAKFSFELRKVDTENKYSSEFLSGQIKPDVLSKIILDNAFDGNSMSPKKNYLLCVGKQSLSLEVGDQDRAIIDKDDTQTSFVQFKLTPLGFLILKGDKCLQTEAQAA